MILPLQRDGILATCGQAWDAAWQSVNAGVEESERQMKRRLLRVLDVDAPQVRINGKLHKRVGRYEAGYKTRRSL